MLVNEAKLIWLYHALASVCKLGRSSSNWPSKFSPLLAAGVMWDAEELGLQLLFFLGCYI